MVNMKEAVEKTEGKLEDPVAENGDNWSLGQRQLLCMARVLLMKPRILCMDEATASVDNHTDALIQSTIRDKFKHATIITIAHRLETIADSDRVVVMDDGNVVEFDTPLALLDDEKSSFHSLCSAGGPQQYAKLRGLADGSILPDSAEGQI